MRLVLLIIFLVLATPASAAEPIVGQVSVVDGDTIEIRGQRIRFAGMDAFESGQLCSDSRGERYRCGQRAAFALADWIGRRNVACLPTGKSWDRIVALCRVSGEDLGAWMVRQGWAVDDDRFEPDYSGLETKARQSGIGAWEGSFDWPREWRDRH